MDSQSSRRPAFTSQAKRARRAIGWPGGHPHLHNDQYDGLHPSKIPDFIFLKETKDNWPMVKDPYEGGTFDASRTPWWTHWIIAFAHTKTIMETPDICKLYRWRFSGVVPGIETMNLTDEWELWEMLQDGYHGYAFDFEQGQEGELTDRLWGFLDEARKGL